MAQVRNIINLRVAQISKASVRGRCSLKLDADEATKRRALSVMASWLVETARMFHLADDLGPLGKMIADSAPSAPPPSASTGRSRARRSSSPKKKPKNTASGPASA